MATFVFSFIGICAAIAFVFFIAGFCVGHAYGMDKAIGYYEHIDKMEEQLNNAK